MVIEMMGGEINVESKENKGSCFFFTAVFGQEKEVNSLEADSYEPLVFSNQTIKKVLLAEDDLVSRKMMTIIMKKIGFETLAVENGRDAISAFENERFALIFMDVNMPFLDGYTATSLIRTQEQTLDYYTPIIAMTASALKGDREKCLEAGMDDYLSKPINIYQVADILRKYVKNENSERQDVGSNPYLIETVRALMADSGLDRTTSEKLVNAFCCQAQALIMGIKNNISNKNAQGTGLLLHQLKGSAGNVRARQIARLALEAEGALECFDVDTVGQVLSEIEDALETLMATGREHKVDQ